MTESGHEAGGDFAAIGDKQNWATEQPEGDEIQNPFIVAYIMIPHGLVGLPAFQAALTLDRSKGNIAIYDVVVEQVLEPALV